MIKRLRMLPRLVQIACLSLIICAIVVYFWLFYDLPSLERLQDGFALPSTRIFDRHGVLLYEILPPEQGRNTLVSLDAIPLHCQNAIIATEDANFYYHPGVDAVGVARALWINIRGGDVLAGGSTITQQVARMLLLDPQQRAERTLQRKLKEMILAVRLQQEYSKADVLSLYLNQVYFGNLAYGIEGAARAYFGKSAEDLSLAECALLAGIVQNAVYHDPLTQFERAQDRQTVVLGLMVQNGYITESEATSAQGDTLRFAAVPFPIQAPHFVMAVWAQLERLYPDQLYTDGLDVITTLDLNWQHTAQSTVKNQLDILNHQRWVAANANNAALLAMNPQTGEVLAMLGSPDYFNEQIDGAVNATVAYRQPGSTLKPFTYAAAFDPTRDQPWTAATMVLDVKTPFVTRKLESYIPANYGFKEHGVVLVREALASSYNIPAVVALDEIGIDAMLRLSINAGLSTLNNTLDLAVTLGGGEVRLLDLVQAYSIFPNGGYRVEPVMIQQVTVRDTGETLHQWRAPTLSNRVLDARVAFLITDILSDSGARSGEFGVVSPLDIGRPAAAKTGTTTDFRDNWTVGYTPSLVVGVWVGNANNAPMVDVTGISGAAPIWHEFTRRVLVGQPPASFAQPTGLTRVEVCALSGLLPTPACPHRRFEWFIDGTQPTAPDHLYQQFEIDRMTGLIADEHTPPAQRMLETFIVLPPEALDWGRRNGIKPLPPNADQALADDMRESASTQAPLRILSPAPYSVYQLTPMQPAESQRLRLRSAAPAQTQMLVYLLNGAPLATTTAPFEFWWGLEVGQYELVAQATLADGSQLTSAPIFFEVVAYQSPAARPAGDD